MIDQFAVKTKQKILIVKVRGITTLIAEPQAFGKPKLIDIAMGDSRAILADLRGQGYALKLI